MPRFVVKGLADSNWIASHGTDITEPNDPENSEKAHQYVQRTADRGRNTYIEIADERGEVCTLYPNTITPEGQPPRLESIRSRR